MPLYGHYKHKPHPGVGIDWAQPLAQGLVGFWAINEGSGLSLYDASGISPALGITGAASWASGAPGAALSCTSAGAGAVVTVPLADRFALPITLAVGFRSTAAPSLQVPIWGIMASAASTRIFTLEVTSAPGVLLTFGGTNATSAVTIAANVDHVYSGSCSSGLQTPYLDGVAKSGGTTAFSPSWGSTSQLGVGGGPTFFASRTPNLAVYWAAWWTRVLTAAEHASIAANPWQVFGTPRSYFLMRPSGVAATRVRRTLSDRAGSRGVA